MKFNSFFVVGVPLTRLVRLGSYDESNIINPRRKNKLKPETLLSYPGGDDLDCEQTVRSSTCFESVISNFCFPEGYARIKNTNDVVTPSAVVCFNIKRSVIPGTDCDSVLWCTALRVNEVLETTWLIPYLLDLDMLVSRMKQQGKTAEKINAVLQQHLGYISKNGITTKAARWRCDYFYIIVTDKPCHRWSASVLRTFRELSRSDESVLNLGDILTELEIPVLPWARRSTNNLSLNALKEYLKNSPAASSGTKYGILQQYVDIVTEWPPPLLPCRISPLSRGLITMLHCECKRSKAVEYIIEFLLSPTLTQHCIDLLTGNWTPWGFDSCRTSLADIAIKYYAKSQHSAQFVEPRRNSIRQGFTFEDDNADNSASLSIDESSSGRSRTSMESPKSEVYTGRNKPITLFGCMPGFGYNETILENCDALYSNILVSELSAGTLVWLQLCMMMEQKTVVACGDIVKRGPIVLLLSELVRPFSWPHPLIPVLPSSIRPMEMIESPIPFIIGVNRLNLDRNKMRSLTETRTDVTVARSKSTCLHKNCSQCAMHRDLKSCDKCSFHLVFELLDLARWATHELADSVTASNLLKSAPNILGGSVTSSTPCRGLPQADESPKSTPYPNTSYSHLTMSTGSTFVRCSGTVAVSCDNMFTNIHSGEANSVDSCTCGVQPQPMSTQWTAESPDGFEQVCLVVPTVSGRGRLLIPDEVLKRFDMTEAASAEAATGKMDSPGLDLTPRTNFLVWNQVLPEHKQSYAGDIKLMLRYNWPCDVPSGSFDRYTVLDRTLVPSAFHKTFFYLSRLQHAGNTWLTYHDRKIDSMTKIIQSVECLESHGTLRWVEDIKDDLEIEVQAMKQTVRCQRNKLTLLLILLPNLFLNYTVKLVFLLARGPSPSGKEILQTRRTYLSKSSGGNVMKRLDSCFATPSSTDAMSEMSPSPILDPHEDLISELLFFVVFNELKKADINTRRFDFERESVFESLNFDFRPNPVCSCCCCSAVTCEAFDEIKSRAIREAEEIHDQSDRPHSPTKKGPQSFFSKWIGTGSGEKEGEMSASSALSRQRKILRLLKAQSKSEADSAVSSTSCPSELADFPMVLDRMLSEIITLVAQFEKFENDVRENSVSEDATTDVLEKLTNLIKPKRLDPENVVHTMGCLSQWKSYLLAHYATQMSCQYQCSFETS